MATIPTESRIFADRYCREAKRLEASHAALISPDTTTWADALAALFKRMEAAGSTIKQAALVRQAIARLDGIPAADAMHIGFVGHASGKRLAALVFAAFSAGRHPLGLDEDGLLVLQHGLITSRSHATLQADKVLTYISWHAMARLHERGYRLDAGSAFDVFGYLGILGLLTRRSDQHIRGGMCLRHGDALAVGSIKHAAVRNIGDDRLMDGTFLDVRTVLPANEVANQAMLDQGRIACAVVEEWLPDRDIGRAEELAEKIPFLPRREDDFTLRSAVHA